MKIWHLASPVQGERHVDRDAGNPPPEPGGTGEVTGAPRFEAAWVKGPVKWGGLIVRQRLSENERPRHMVRDARTDRYPVP